MTDFGEAPQPTHELPAGELVSRAERIEAQPLDQRAAGFGQLHDALLAELERSDQPRSGSFQAQPGASRA